MDSQTTACGVYPRECGGTIPSKHGCHRRQGLSPRVRGNPTETVISRFFRWSIPASAGEPPNSVGSVHKRTGLSPRVRGNLTGQLRRLLKKGSIPASAGEPSCPPVPCLSKSVYPRECGGTIFAGSLGLAINGLSPRVRGNLFQQFPLRVYTRSIPASAGEPRRRGLSCTRRRVYPRECGGTSIIRAPVWSRGGLSPRVRGNPKHPLAMGLSKRSIPASAGEPYSKSAQVSKGTVYPRECGGTVA